MDLYEDVPYPGFPFPQTHPDRLALVGTLRGLRPAPPDSSRVLEIGCADGLNTVAMAAHAPGLQAVGFDRAGAPLARGRELAAKLGLTNVRLEQLDVLKSTEQLGQFDYVIAHGMYSWAAPDVRDAIVRTCAERLAPSGLAFVSFNSFPGAHIRQMLREMTFAHAGEVREPARLIGKARELYELMAPWTQERPDGYGQLLHQELERLRGLPDHSLIHDDLGETYEAVWLRDFMAHAARHGLAYVAEAEHEDLRYDRHPPGFDDVLDSVAGDDVVRWEQYSDFLSGRPFRQAVLCHTGAKTVRPLDPTAPQRLLAELGPAARSEHVDLRAGNGGGPPQVLERAIEALAAVHPRPMDHEELLEVTRTDPPGLLGPALVSGFRRSLIDFRAALPRFTVEPPEYPETSALIRQLASEGRMLVSLSHELVNMDDPFGRVMLRQLDGTRDRAGLLDALVAELGNEDLRAQVAQGLEHNLRSLGSLALLQA
jgi:predicted O-methyltransferase YrrM